MVENVQQIVSTPADQSKPLPGEVREELKITFSATLDRMETLISKVQVLAVQAENYFWSHRSTALRSVLTGENGDADMLDDCVTGAEKLCLAAYPMLNEITERLHYISGVAGEYIPLGSATVETESPPAEPPNPGTYTMDYAGDTVWDDIYDTNDPPILIGSPTRTFYMPTVREVCATLNSYVAQMRDWSDNAEGWQDEGILSIRQMYGAALLELYARTRQVINLLGPLFPPVICNYFPRVTTPDGITGNTENFLPTECRFVKKDTQSIEIALYAGAYQVPFSAAIGSGYADWFNTPTVVSNGEKVYPRRGGIISVEQMTLEDSADDLTGVYEIYECADNLVISNEDLISESYESQVLDNIYGTTFKMRLIRKAEEDTSGVIHVQYRTNIDDLDVDEGHFEQEFSWEFDATGVNEHNTPIAKNPTGQLFIWQRYDSTIDVQPVTCNTPITNVTEDTLFMGTYLNTLAVNGAVYSILSDGTYLYIGGLFDAVGGESITNLARITLETGVVDSGWTPNPDGRISSIAKDSSGNIYVGGLFTTIDSVTRTYLAKFNSSGILQVWAPNPNAWVSAIDVDGLDNVYVGGSFSIIDSVAQRDIAKFDSSGTLLSFKIGLNSSVYAIAHDSFNNVFIGGSRLVAYSVAGVFIDWFPNPNGNIYAICVDNSDNVYVGGSFSTIYDCEDTSVRQTVHNLAKYDTDLDLVASFTPDPDDTVYAIYYDSSDNIYVGGYFTTIDSVDRTYLAMFNAAGAIQAWAQNPNSFVRAIHCTATHVFVGGHFTDPYVGAFAYAGALGLPVPGWVPTP